MKKNSLFPVTAVQKLSFSDGRNRGLDLESSSRRRLKDLPTWMSMPPARRVPTSRQFPVQLPPPQRVKPVPGEWERATSPPSTHRPVSSVPSPPRSTAGRRAPSYASLPAHPSHPLPLDNNISRLPPSAAPHLPTVPRVRDADGGIRPDPHPSTRQNRPPLGR